MTLGVGDLGRLKSGGEPMSIAEIDGTQALCIWQVGGKTYREKFPLSILEKYTKPTLAMPFIDV
ncbi:MAG: DUF2158 domain-containing protein [Hyphomonadaceae bacterium]